MQRRNRVNRQLTVCRVYSGNSNRSYAAPAAGTAALEAVFLGVVINLQLGTFCCAQTVCVMIHGVAMSHCWRYAVVPLSQQQCHICSFDSPTNTCHHMQDAQQRNVAFDPAIQHGCHSLCLTLNCMTQLCTTLHNSACCCSPVEGPFLCAWSKSLTCHRRSLTARCAATISSQHSVAKVCTTYSVGSSSFVARWHPFAACLCYCCCFSLLLCFTSHQRRPFG